MAGASMQLKSKGLRLSEEAESSAIRRDPSKLRPKVTDAYSAFASLDAENDGGPKITTTEGLPDILGSPPAYGS